MNTVTCLIPLIFPSKNTISFYFKSLLSLQKDYKLACLVKYLLIRYFPRFSCLARNNDAFPGVHSIFGNVRQWITILSIANNGGLRWLHCYLLVLCGTVLRRPQFFLNMWVLKLQNDTHTINHVRFCDLK